MRILLFIGFVALCIATFISICNAMSSFQDPSTWQNMEDSDEDC